MAVTIIDTYSEITSLVEQMGGAFQKSIWEQYLRNISEELLDKVSKDSESYDFENDILPVMNLLFQYPERVNEAHESFLFAIDNLDAKIKIATGTALQAQLVFYVGLCNGAGWATTLGGKPTVLLGLEKIVELSWHDKQTMTALIYHELGHIWHDSVGILRRETTSTQEKHMWQMFQEGVAMYFEQLLVDDFSFYHQDKNGWLDWCIANKKALNTEFLRRLQTNSSAQDFFGDWQEYRGHSDVGYFIGCEFVKWLLHKYTISDVANFEPRKVFEEFCEYATGR